MEFDKEYYDKLFKFFQDNNNVVYNISDLADDTEKFICHSLVYQMVRNPFDAQVRISNDSKQIYIVEFFQNVLDAQAIEKIKAGVYIKEFNSIKNTPLGQSIEPVIERPKITQAKKSPWD